MIPTHFDANGIPDDFGSKNSIWLLPIIAFVILIGMRVLSHYPHQLNYWIKITEVNAPKQYQFGIHILRFATLYVILLFFYISYTTVKIAVNSEINRLGNWFLPVVLGSAMVLLLYILIQMKSIK
jgi:energy-coupling factor transporter transmembrane protein EcfT